MNSVNIIGRLTRDPELKRLDEGRSLCTFTLAVDDVHSKEDRADFLRVSVFGNPGELCEKYLRKGFLAGVTGRLRTDTYTDAEGVVRYPVKVVAENVRFLQWPERAAGEGAQRPASERKKAAKEA
ncbi:MAG: single-stranded DNA-binding protein [Clostridiales Family XIII bacterium]|jgi:single-strand DNA-binding protein|nr:single-stranded DNA-binding protein [Clostridiales Family XIII bacterium]